MKENKDTPLMLNCNEISVNPKDYWDEIIQIAFIEDAYKNIIISRLAYEDEIYIEHNDQANCLYSYYQNVYFLLEENYLTINVKNPTRAYNMPSELKIVFNNAVENLHEILSELKASTLEI